MLSPRKYIIFWYFSVPKLPPNILDNCQMKIYITFIQFMKMTSNYLTTILNSETFLYLPRNNTKNYLKKVWHSYNIQHQLKHFRNVILIKRINAKNYILDYFKRFLGLIYAFTDTSNFLKIPGHTKRKHY